LKLSNPHPVKVVLLGLLNDESEKVKRWALNSLALLGTGRDADPIVHAVLRNRGEPDLVGAGISALAALVPPERLTQMLMKHDMPLEGGLLLAAAQQTPLFDAHLRGLKLDVDKAVASDLRMGSLLVGLRRAPDHLFSPRHPNSTIIGELNTHDDALVAQYSVWAIVESPELSLRDLKLHIEDVESLPENVRGWIYRLIATSRETAETYQDVLQTGSRDASADTREGLAAGIRDVVYEGIEPFVIEWFLREQSDSVRQRLLEHMAAHGHAFPRYAEIVLGIYRQAGKGSLIRVRLEAAARQTRLHTEMKVIELDADHRDLFSKVPALDVRASNSVQSTLPAAVSNVKPSPKKEPMPEPESVRVLIVTALPKEHAAVLATLAQHRTVGVARDPNVYTLGVYPSAEGKKQRAVLVCQSGMGKANAAAVGALAISSFPNADHLLMVGIAGGCPHPDKPDEHVRLGDIVVSSEKGIVEYDFVKETSEGKEIRSHPQKPSRRLLNTVNYITSAELLAQRPLDAVIAEALKQLPEEFSRPSAERDVLHDGDGKVVPHPDDRARRGERPRTFTGAVATSDALQKNPKTRDMLRDRFGARAIEMEASGMQTAAWAAGKDILAVRGVCDYCDEFKDDAWQGYAAVVAAAFTRTVVEAMPDEWFP
jgi:nucleoside phosphorylase